MALPPYDHEHSFSTQVLIDFAQYFGGHSADYVRLEADQPCKLWIYQRGGGSFQYTRGLRRNTPIDLTTYHIMKVIIIPTTAGTSTNLYVHATSDGED